MKTNDDLLIKDPKTNFRLAFAILVAYGIAAERIFGNRFRYLRDYSAVYEMNFMDIIT